MPQCQKCGDIVQRPCLFSVANDNRRVIRSQINMTPNDTLRSTSYAEGLAHIAKRQNKSRRALVESHINSIARFLEYGEICNSAGVRIYDIEKLIEAAYGSDPSYRWMSDFLRYADCPMKQKPHWRVLPKLIILDLALQIQRPDLWRSICAAKAANDNRVPPVAAE